MSKVSRDAGVFIWYACDLHDPFLMKGMDEAVREIVKAKEQGRKVAIASDFDCDGIFSAYILWKGFQRLDWILKFLRRTV